MKIGIIVAMHKELLMLTALFSNATVEHVGNKDFYCGTIGETEVVIQQCGIGKVNAAIGCQEMIKGFAPDVIVSSGCAGGNGDDIEVQDVVVSAELAYHDVYCGTAIDTTTVYGQVQGLPARFQADAALLDKARALADRLAADPSSQFRIHTGLIVTGDWFVDSKEKMRDILGHFPEAKAVDMESCAIAQTCYINRVPFISFRVISDIPLRDTDASQYHDFWNTVADHSFLVTRTFLESL